MKVTFIVLLIRLLGLTALVAPLTAEAQPAGKVPRIGVMGEYSPTHPFVPAFRQGLRELCTEGENIVIEYQYLHGVPDRVPALAAELIRLNVDILVVGGTVSARLAKAQTTTVPIVFTTAGDPVSRGLVASLARPGGNATGLSVLLSPELSGKHLELLKAVVSKVSRVTVLYNPVNPITRPGEAGPGFGRGTVGRGGTPAERIGERVFGADRVARRCRPRGLRPGVRQRAGPTFQAGSQEPFAGNLQQERVCRGRWSSTSRPRKHSG